MKRLFLFLMIFLLISQASAVEIKGVDFEIPDSYQGGEVKSYGYIFNNESTFSILCVDFLTDSGYAEIASESSFRKNVTVGSHEAVHCVNDRNVSRIFYSIGNSIFSISWNSSEITPEIEKLISDSPSSNLTALQFHSKLDNEVAEYLIEKEFEDEGIFPGDSEWDDFDRDYIWDLLY